MGRRSMRGMVLLVAPAPRSTPTPLQRLRLGLARLGCGRRAQMGLGMLAVAGLILSAAALIVVRAPTRAAEASPGIAEGSLSPQSASRPIRDPGLWALIAQLPPHAPPATGPPATGGPAAASASDGAGSTAAASALAGNGIPQVALQAYRNAAALADAAQPACRISWPLLAAIGRIESNHGRTSGDLLTDGTSRPPVMGLLLDGSGGFAVIADTDGGRLDGSAQFDRAIGPMQFIPSTWAMYAADGNGDGTSDPFNIFDASLAAATYLCRAGGDLSTPEGLQRAVFSYNHVQSYVDAVLALANAYSAQFDQGALPVTPVTDAPTAADLPPATVGGPAPGADSIAPATPSPSTSPDPTSDPTAGSSGPTGGASPSGPSSGVGSASPSESGEPGESTSPPASSGGPGSSSASDPPGGPASSGASGSPGAPSASDSGGSDSGGSDSGASDSAGGEPPTPGQTGSASPDPAADEPDPGAASAGGLS